jgi:hypothetical protein
MKEEEEPFIPTFATKEELKQHDICEATLQNGNTFKCVLNKRMRGWGFPAWEVRILRGSQRGFITHVGDEHLIVIKAYDPSAKRAPIVWRQ